MIKSLFQTALTDLDTTDKDNIGQLRYEDDGKVYRYVKNISATALVANGACLKALTSVLSAINQKVRSVDTTTAATAQLSIPGGVPVTAIAASGASTGDHGWIQVAGAARVTMVTSDTTASASGWPGRLSICTNLAATAFWDVPESPTANSASTAYCYVKGVRLLAKMATGTASNARSAAVEVLCL
ncbi:MAG: hypothetical protein ACXAEN_20935 [Candidatus Thorarchaeota archaeon]|jgi:hypothetical protein